MGLAEGLEEAFRDEVERSALTLYDVARAIATDWHERSHSDYLIQRLTEALEEVEEGRPVKIVVSLPPGSGKSTTGSVALPLYALSRHPNWHVGLVSAEGSLSAKWSRDCRRHIVEGTVPVNLDPDSRAVTEWSTTVGGSLIARGIGGALAGRRLNVAVIDDPVKNFKDAHQPNQREALWEAWRSVIRTRLHPASLCLLVMTRWHEDDLAGRLLAEAERDGWESVVIPAIADSPDDPLGRSIGEPLLSPQIEETPEEALARWHHTKAEVGSYVWDALYQQKPSPPGGAVFNPEWWQYHNPATVPPDHEGTWLTSWDLTFGTGGSASGDYVVGQVWQHHEGHAYLIDQVRGRWTFNEQLRQIRTLADKYPQCTAHLVEAAANGAAAIDTLKSEIPGVVPVKPQGSKEIRAQSVAPMIEAGQVLLPETSHFTEELVVELRGFPSSVHDDQVDALTQALSRFRSKGKAQVHMTYPGSGVSSTPKSLGAVLRGGRF